MDDSSNPKWSASGSGQCTPSIPSRRMYKASGGNYMSIAVVMLPIWIIRQTVKVIGSREFWESWNSEQRIKDRIDQAFKLTFDVSLKPLVLRHLCLLESAAALILCDGTSVKFSANAWRTRSSSLFSKSHCYDSKILFKRTEYAMVDSLQDEKNMRAA
jgi:hypothetical protein